MKHYTLLYTLLLILLCATTHIDAAYTSSSSASSSQAASVVDDEVLPPFVRISSNDGGEIVVPREVVVRFDPLKNMIPSWGESGTATFSIKTLNYTELQTFG